MFDRAGEAWPRSQSLVADDPENGELFGIAADSHGTRTVIADSSYNGTAPRSGTVYVFEPVETTSTDEPLIGVASGLVAFVLLVLWALRRRRSATV